MSVAPLHVAGLVVAGGAGRRMGGEKPLMPFRGGVLLDAVIARMAPQVAPLALNVAKASLPLYRARYGTAHVLLTDEGPAHSGPLAGLLAGLAWLARETTADWLASVPGDTPFLPGDLVAQLWAGREGAQQRPVVLRAEGQIQSLCALWPRMALSPLREGVDAGRLASVRDALSALDARVIDALGEPGAFLNVNTPEDLAEAERRA